MPLKYPKITIDRNQSNECGHEFDEIKDKELQQQQQSVAITNEHMSWLVMNTEQKGTHNPNDLLVLMYGIYVNGAHDTVLALDLSGFS